MRTTLFLALTSLLAAGCAGAGDPPLDCDFDVVIASSTCRYYDNPDVFASDSWFLDLTGTAKGPESTQLSLEDTNAIQINTSCDGWTGTGHSSICISKTGEAKTTDWSASVEQLTSNSAARNYSIVATVKQVLISPSCQTQKTTALAKSCP